MSIQPIDMQILFTKMGQVGKEQAAQKDLASQQQALGNSEIVKQTDRKSHSVNQTEKLSDGPKKTEKDSQKKRDKGERGAEVKEAGEADSSDSNHEKEIFKDPDLGHHIDITG